MKTQKITIAEIEYVAFSLAKELMTWNEPIPDFGTRFPNILESCVASPFVGFNRKDLYRGLVGKVSILFYLMIKNHPFQNGNKRIAVMTLLYFLRKNDKWIKIDNKNLYNLARWVAGSKPISRDEIISLIQTVIKKHLIDFD